MELNIINELPAEWHPQIQEYFRGERQNFDVKITLTGTEFQKTVWKAMMKIPYGKVMTYGEIAAVIGRPSAARAVGNACNANKFPIVVPCHRVVAANGIGGYGYGGLEIKRKLLKLEKAPKELWMTKKAQ